MDTELFVRLRRGETEAFSDLFRMHESMMYRTAYLYMKNRADALDVVQEAACRAYRNIRRLREPEHAGTWLVRITMNCAVDMLRRHGREQYYAPDMLENMGLMDEDEAKAVIERISLDKLMDVLTADEKQIVMLRYYCGCTFADIARELSIPLGTAKTILYRSLDKLKKRAMEGNEDE